MKTKLLLAIVVSAITVGNTFAGPSSYCPPPSESDKCPIECCPDSNGNLEFGYQTAYIFRGVRLADDVVFADVNYTFEKCNIPITLGAKHVTSLSSVTTGLSNLPGGTGGDHTDLYARVALPSMYGFQTSVGYNHYFYANQRLPEGAAGHGNWGDSHGAFSVTISRELFCGLVLSYNRAYDFNVPQNYGPVGMGLGAQQEDGGSWIHTLGLDKSFCISDNVSLDLSGGVLYTDGVWEQAWTGMDGSLDRNTSSGWNSYYLRAALPVSLSGCATLIPYVGYNGSPDAWMADGVNGDFNASTNDNDVFHGGVSVKVGF